MQKKMPQAALCQPQSPPHHAPTPPPPLRSIRRNLRTLWLVTTAVPSAIPTVAGTARDGPSRTRPLCSCPPPLALCGSMALGWSFGTGSWRVVPTSVFSAPHTRPAKRTESASNYSVPIHRIPAMLAFMSS